jgi:hypothetical protein
MSPKIHLTLAVAACLLLSNCQLINTALRLAPLLLLAETDGKHPAAGKTPEMRGKEIEQRGTRGLLPAGHDIDSGLAFKR